MAKAAIQAKPTEFHRLLRMLDDCGLLKRLYSQNIDSLEAKVDFDIFTTDKTCRCVLLHGNLATLQYENVLVCTCWRITCPFSNAASRYNVKNAYRDENKIMLWERD